MAFTKIQIKKAKATVDSPVVGYLKKASAFSFKNDEDEQVTLGKLILTDKQGQNAVVTYLYGNNVDLVSSLINGANTRISKRVVKDNETGNEFNVQDVEQDLDDKI